MAVKLKKSDLIKHLAALLRPAVRLALRHGGSVQELIECLKLVIFEEAKREIKTGVTASKISLVTGLHRRDVTRLSKNETKFDSSDSVPLKVVGYWQSARKSKALSFGKDSSEFNALCRAVSQDVNPASVLAELERVGAVVRDGDKVKLVKESYIPSGDASAGLAVLAADASDLFEAAHENITAPKEVPNLHRRTMYDNVHPAAVPELRRWLMEEGLALHERARKKISRFDQDINPSNCPEKGVKVVIGTFGKVYEGGEN